MSFAAVRGAATPAQRWLDGALAAAARDRRLDVTSLSMPQLLEYSLRTQPDRVFMTNGSTGVQTRNSAMRAQAARVARALEAAGLRGARALVAARGHERACAVYLALGFAGLLPFYADPLSTQFELQYYMELVEPRVVLCDAATEAAVRAACAGAGARPGAGAGVRVLPIHGEELLDFCSGYEDNVDGYRVLESDPLASLLMLPTSGSTGMPKAARFDSRGQIQQLATTWMHFTEFPPTRRALVLTTPQWATFSLTLTTCCVFGVELLLTPAPPSVHHVLHMLETYKPTWTFLGPPFAKELLKAAERPHFASLRTLITLGSQAPPALHDQLKGLMPEGGAVCDGYGMTEAQGFVALSKPGAPRGCTGPVANVLHYKLVKENGEEAGVDEEGELYIKGDCIISGYHKNESELASSMAEGWLRTGDAFTRDARGRLYYRRRIKFSFKYNNQLVCPEELEALVGALPFVAECAVCCSARGPAAAVALRPPAPPEPEARREIHQLIESTLSDHKRLRGGVAFVPSLPRTHTGKLHRAGTADLLRQLSEQGRCQ